MAVAYRNYSQNEIYKELTHEKDSSPRFALPGLRRLFLLRRRPPLHRQFDSLRSPDGQNPAGADRFNARLGIPGLGRPRQSMDVRSSLHPLRLYDFLENAG